MLSIGSSSHSSATAVVLMSRSIVYSSESDTVMTSFHPLVLSIVLCLAISSFVCGQSKLPPGVQVRQTLTFQIRATGEFDFNLGSSATYSKEDYSLRVILTPGFWPDADNVPANRSNLDQAFETYLRAAGEYIFINKKDELAKVEQKYKELEELIYQHVPESLIARARQVTSARKLLLQCLDPSLAPDENRREKLRAELAEIEKKAYLKLLGHCSEKEKAAFETFVLNFHYSILPLPSLLHDQLLATRGFPAKNHRVGWELSPACSIVPSDNAGGLIPEENDARDLIYLLGLTSIDPSKSQTISNRYLQYETSRSNAKDVAAKIKSAQDFKSAVFALLTENQQTEMRAGLFTAQLRRHGIFAWDKFSEKPPHEIRSIFQPDSLEKIKAIAPKVAADIRESVNATSIAFFQLISNEKLDGLTDLDYSFPIEIILSIRLPAPR